MTLKALEEYRKTCALNLQKATHWLKVSEKNEDQARSLADEAQQQVNHWQMELDDTDREIREQMEIERNEREKES